MIESKWYLKINLNAENKRGLKRKNPKQSDPTIKM